MSLKISADVSVDRTETVGPGGERVITTTTMTTSGSGNKQRQIDNFNRDYERAQDNLNMSLRAPRAGDQYYVEKALEKRYDDEEKAGLPRRVIEWIVRVMGGQVSAPPSLDARSVHNFFKDGVVLCKLINVLLKAAGMPTVPFRKKANAAFVALSNLDSFLGAARAFGISEVALFQPSDLYEGRKGHLLNALNCLDALGRLSNLKGFRPEYEEAVPPKADWCKEDDE